MKTTRSLNIVFAMLSESGHYNGSFKLARRLRERGHRIFYLGFADFAQTVNAQGFTFIPFADDLLPEGYLKTFAASQLNPAKGLLRKWRKRRSDEKVFTEYLRRIENGCLDETLLSCKPDLLLCDTFVWYVAIRALHIGIPTMTLGTNLALYRNPSIPPVVSSILPRRTRWSAFIVLTAWDWMRFKFFFTKRLASHLWGAYRFPSRMHHLVSIFLRIAKKSGYPCHENKTYLFGEMGPRLLLPEIVLCPQSFQFLGEAAEGKRYLGKFADFERHEDPLEPACLDESKPLVYCSLGTAAFFYPYSPRFYKAVMDASIVKRDWQFVLHIGEQYETDQFGEPGPNLIIRKRVPQLALLKKASVMVTHGGLNSIMECIHFTVPMVIVPGLRDQPGSAARAFHHGIALTTSMSRITPEKLINLVSRAMKDESLRRSLEIMKQKISTEEDIDSLINFIEKKSNPQFNNHSSGQFCR